MRKFYLKRAYLFAAVIITLIGIMFVDNSVYAEETKETDVEYCYEVDEYGNNCAVGFYYNGEFFKYEYDERGVIKYILNSDEKPVVYYNCDNKGIINAVYSWNEEQWCVNNDKSFIGNINKMRWLGYIYDDNTGYYLVYDRYYNPIEGAYVDGVSNDFAFSDSNPFIVSDEGIMQIDAYYNEMAADKWANTLLADSNYGTSITYESNWYSGLSGVEIVARCIYGESNGKFNDEEDAIAWVILNRVNNSDFPNTPKDVVTAKSQFKEIIGSEKETERAREIVSTSMQWRNATYLACLLCTTTNKSEWRELVDSYITNQYFFYAYTVAKNNRNDKTKKRFTGTNANSLYYGSNQIKDVYVVGYGSVSSFEALFNEEIEESSRNIFYNYK